MLSVVIPTWNRVGSLLEVLAALSAATPPAGGFEIVVVSDGSTDGTAAALRGKSLPVPLRFEEQRNQGPGAARNRGVELASGERILFLGDDTVPAADCLVRHVERAAREADPAKIAVLGYTDWHRRMKVSRFLRHINENGLQFGYSIIPDPDKVPFNFFYTSNISIGRDLFRSLGGFDTDFPAAAWEDVEFAFRAEKAGLRIVYEPAARTEHDHPTSVASFLRRQRKAGECGAIFAKKHPELADWLGVPCVVEVREDLRAKLRRAAVELGSRVDPLFSPNLCDAVMRQAYLAGLRDALRPAAPLPR